MEGCYYFLLKTALVFICVAYPILLFIYIWSFPIYVIISYFIWIILSLIWICNYDSWFSFKHVATVNIVVIGLLDVLFTIILYKGYDGQFGDNSELMTIIYPLLNLPAICFVGYNLSQMFEKQRALKADIMRKEITEIISHYMQDVRSLKLKTNEYIDNNREINILLNLICSCTNNKSLKINYDKFEQYRFEYQARALIASSEFNNLPPKKTEFYAFIKSQDKNVRSCKEVLQMKNSYNYNALKKIHRIFTREKLDKIDINQQLSKIKKYGGQAR